MEIYRSDLNSGKATVIPDSDGLFSPRVSPDGRYIAALTGSQTEMMVFDTHTNHCGRVRIADRVLEPVLNLKDLPQVVDIFTAWIGLTPDDAPVVIRDRSVQEVYALDLR